MIDAKDFPYFGTVSHGTFRDVDLIDSFTAVLSRLDADGRYADLIKDSLAKAGVNDDWTLSEYVELLFDALNEYAPAGYYFGSHCGDGSGFGYWEVGQE